MDENRMIHTIDPWYETYRTIGDRAFSTPNLTWHPEYKTFLSYENGRICSYDKDSGKLNGSASFDVGEGINLLVVAPFDNKTFVVQDDEINAVNLEFSRTLKYDKKIDHRRVGFQIR